MMKNGVALIITLGIITIITAIILNTVTLVDASFKHVAKIQTLTQNQLILSSMNTALNKLTGKVTTPEALQALMGEFPGLSDDSGTFILSFALRPLQGKININSIFKEDNKTVDPAYEELFFNILNLYEVRNPDHMVKLIADTIDLDTVDRTPESERINVTADFSNGEIKSFELLHRLSEIYARDMKDPSIMKVPWQDYFYLGPLFTKTTLDCDFMSWEIAKAANLKVNGTEGLDQISCSALPGDQNVTLSRYNIAPFQKGASYRIEVEAEFDIEGKKGKFQAQYDLKDKRIYNIRSFTTI